MSFKMICSFDEILPLGHSDMHVWLADISHFKSDISMLKTLLNDEEVAQAERFVKEADGLHYIFSHGLLRLILAVYLEVAAKSILFEKMDEGKPRLVLNDGVELDFNLSHSGDKVMIGVAKSTAVGVDVELMRTGIEIKSIIKRICTASESNLLLEMKELDRIQAFYRCWTLKEAFVKAIGKGMAFPFDELEVDILSEGPFTLKKANNLYDSWVLRSLDIAGNYQAAIVNKDNIKNFYYYECNDLGVFNLL